MSKTGILYLFTNRFPYKGGEPFLETEIKFLSEAFSKIIVLPLEVSGDPLNTVPKNVEVIEIKGQQLSLKRIIVNNFSLITGRFIVEFFKSKHRFKYLSQFKWNLFQLAGFIQKADTLLKTVESNAVCYTYWFNEWGSILTLAKQKGLKGKFITRMHGYDFDEQQNGRGYFSFRSVELPLWNHIYQVSEYGLNYVKQQYPSAKNISVSRLGVNDLGESPVAQGMTYTLVSCSNFVALKRVKLIVDILRFLEVPFHWLHFGDGNGKEETEMYAKSNLNSLSFEFKGYWENAALMEFYKNNAVDLFINVSELEGLPVSLMEAISFGIPVVGCDICGVPELVNAQTGLLLDKDFRPEIAAHKIEEFLKSKTRNADFRKGVKSYYKQNFDAERNYRNFATELIN